MYVDKFNLKNIIVIGKLVLSHVVERIHYGNTKRASYKRQLR